METKEYFTPCRDCINHVGGECAEGRGRTAENDGCIETVYTGCTLSELENAPNIPKKYVSRKTKTQTI